MIGLLHWRTKDIRGKRFGRLIVSEYAGRRSRRILWHCLCDCGQMTIVQGGNLHTGHTTSCGCFARDQQRLTKLKHGMYGTPEYRSWSGAKERCSNPNDSRFERYGGRGIKMCQRWRDSFAVFFADMGKRPAKHSLDRIDNDGNYEPDNCRWATNTEQSRNRKQNKLLTLHGETHCIATWADMLDLDRCNIYARISRGWSTEMALTTPIGDKRSHV